MQYKNKKTIEEEIGTTAVYNQMVFDTLTPNQKEMFFANMNRVITLFTQIEDDNLNAIKEMIREKMKNQNNPFFYDENRLFLEFMNELLQNLDNLNKE